jgi:hypothetical protein
MIQFFEFFISEVFKYYRLPDTFYRQLTVQWVAVSCFLPHFFLQFYFLQLVYLLVLRRIAH